MVHIYVTTSNRYLVLRRLEHEDGCWCRVMLLNVESMQLFKRHTYSTPFPVEDPNDNELALFARWQLAPETFC